LGLNLVSKLRPVHYRHKIDEDNEALSNGIIAQEMEQALLDCGIAKNSLLMLQHKPNNKENESQYWVDYTKMIPILTKAIQEQQAQIEELKSKLN
ncbi:MAG: tail fiber domain-containing protein, partial [Dolichospermum sp.]